MDLIIELLKYVMPAAMVLVGVYLMTNWNKERQEAKDRIKIQSETLSTIIPIRLTAYERGILFLERISPENLMTRVDAAGKSARQMYAALQFEIRTEYEHNMAQQLYVSQEAWMELFKAKEQTLALIHRCYSDLPKDASGVQLGRRIVETVMRSQSSPTRQAIAAMKQDILRMYKMI